MGFTMRVTWAVLLYNVNIFALEENQTDLIKNITLALSSFFHINCLVIFQRFNSTLTSFDTFKAFSTELTTSVAVYTFEDRQMRKSCPKPMNLIIGGDLKREFAGFMNGQSMSDEIWLVFLSSPVLEFFEDSRPSFDSEVLAAEILSPQEVRFQEVYSVDYDFPLRMVDFGNWTRQDGLSLPQRPFYHRRSDLEGKVLRIGSNENWPICSFNGGLWDGYMPRIWKEIETLINCTTVPVRSVDNSTGLRFSNGTWNGLMGMLLSEKIDVIAAELTMTKSRTSLIRFGYLPIRARYQIYFKGLGYGLEWQAIFKPLALSTWLALCGWTIIGSACTYICYYYYYKNTGHEETESRNFTKIESFFFILQSLCQQGYPFVPKSLSCRIVFIMAYALSTIMIPSYSASLISSLTNQMPIKPFDSLEAMVNNGKYKLLVRKNSATYTQFSQATDPLYMKAYKRLMNHAHINPPFESTAQILNDIVCKEKKFALFGIDVIIDLKMEYQEPRCSILKFSKPLTPVFVGLGLRKDSPYSRLIDHKLQKLQNIGALSRLKANIHPLRKRGPRGVSFRQVEVDETFQMFLLLLLGMILSTVILIIEKTTWKSNGRLTKSSRTRNSSRVHSSYMLCLDFYVN